LTVKSIEDAVFHSRFECDRVIIEGPLLRKLREGALLPLEDYSLKPKN